MGRAQRGGWGGHPLVLEAAAPAVKDSSWLCSCKFAFVKLGSPAQGNQPGKKEKKRIKKELLSSVGINKGSGQR